MTRNNSIREALKEINSYFRGLVAGMAVATKRGLDESGELVLKAAKAKFGIYQPAIGPYPAWPKLSSRTISHKHKDTPLLNTGSLRDSIKIRKGAAKQAIIYSEDPRMPIHEYGKGSIPPRPILRPALYENADKVFKVFVDTTQEMIRSR